LSKRLQIAFADGTIPVLVHLLEHGLPHGLHLHLMQAGTDTANTAD
jgi:hypothetical protein